MKRLITSTLIVLYTFFTFSVQAKYTTRHLGNADGLSNSSVNVLFQDSDTFLWAGTWDGLNLYDSRSFRVFFPSAQDSLSISNGVVRDIHEDSSGQIWICTDRGIDCYNRVRDSFTRYFSSFMHGTSLSEHSFHLVQSASGDIFAFVDGHGLFRFDGNTFNLARRVTDCRAEKLFFDAASDLWVLTDSGVLLRNWSEFGSDILAVHYIEESDDIWIQDRSGLRKLGSDTVIGFSGGEANAVDDDGKCLFLGTQDGVYEVDMRTGTCEKILDNVKVMSILCGKRRTIWVGTDMQGIWQLSERAYDFGAVTGVFAGNAVRCFTKNTDGELVVGTKGSGLFFFSEDGKLKRHIDRSSGLSDNAVYALVDDHDVAWIGSDGRGLDYYDKRTKTCRRLKMPDSLVFSSVYCVLPEGRNTLWVGTSGNGLYKFGIERGADGIAVRSFDNYSHSALGSNVVYDLEFDGPSHILSATRGGGLVRLDKGTGKVSAMPSGTADDMLCVMKDAGGTVWAGSGMGLFAFAPGGAVRSYTIADGLPGNTVHCILQDDSGRIWVSTNSGLARIEPEKELIVSYRESDGLQNNEFSDGACFRDGRYLCFGGISGFNRFDPEEVTGDVFNPVFMLKSVVIDNEEHHASTILRDVGGRRLLVLPPGANSVGFTFVPVDYLASDRCEVAYMLTGVSQDWVRAGRSGEIIFSGLRPGNMELLVKHTDSDGNWCPDIYSVSMRVQDWWWRTRLARLLYLVMLLLALSVFLFLLISRYRDRQQRLVEGEIHEAKLDFFTNIAHEFSNSLTLIYGPCEELKQSESVSGRGLKYLDTIEVNTGRMQNLIQQLINFRKSETGHLEIKVGKVDMVALITRELDYFRENINSAGILFRLDCPKEGLVWNADGDSMEKVIFNLLSNALKYTPEGGTVEVSLASGKHGLEMDFTNYGAGIPKEKQTLIFDRYAVLDRFERAVAKGRTSNGIGLAMCKSLVESHGGTISIRSDGSTFTTFHVEIPPLEADPGVPDYSFSDVLPDGADSPVREDKPSVPSLKDKVLVADDDPEILDFVRGILESRFDVLAVNNGKEALAAMRDWDPKVVVSDLYMPEMDGISLLRAMREDRRLKHVPFILLSAKGSVDTQIDALEKGVDDYISKPFHPRHLLASIDRILGREAEIIEYGRSAKSAVERYAGREMDKADRELLSAAVDFVASHIDNENLSADMVAEGLMLSRVQFYRKIKALTGTAPVEFIRNIRLDFAERQLKTTRLTVQEIMYACGFANKSYFYREFAKRFGLTPGECRLSQRSDRQADR